MYSQVPYNRQAQVEGPYAGQPHPQQAYHPQKSSITSCLPKPNFQSSMIYQNHTTTAVRWIFWCRSYYLSSQKKSTDLLLVPQLPITGRNSLTFFIRMSSLQWTSNQNIARVFHSTAKPHFQWLGPHVVHGRGTYCTSTLLWGHQKILLQNHL